MADGDVRRGMMRVMEKSGRRKKNIRGKKTKKGRRYGIRKNKRKMMRSIFMTEVK